MKEHVKDLLKHLVYYVVFLLITTCAVIEYQNYSINRQSEIIENAKLQKLKAKEKDCIKAALWHEARGEGEFGIKAVASVIENRVNHPDYPATYCEVINQRKQFSYTLSAKPTGYYLDASIKPADREVFNQISEIAEKMIEKEFKPVIPTSVLWYTHVSIRNYWTKTKAVVGRIGNHRFYKDKE
jgi:spore germination cell wall hydrolase CwlJ-like protein